MNEITVALAGNPNSGKTTVFNGLTGSHQRTGNWPGVTVERKEGEYRDGDTLVKVVDLPGTYGLTAYSMDEKVARDYIVNHHPDVVVVVIDASNLERNLYLAIQIIELGQKVVLCLNMMDVARKNGLEIDVDRLSSLLGVLAVPTVGNRNDGFDRLKEAIKETALSNKFAGHTQRMVNYGRECEKAIAKLQPLAAELGLPYPTRFLAIKLLETDPEIHGQLSPEAIARVNEVIHELESVVGEDIDTYLAARRYGFIHGLYEECVRKRMTLESKISLSDSLDKVFTNKFLGIPIFLFLMWLCFQLVFQLGNPIADRIDSGIGWFGGNLNTLLLRIGVPRWISSFFTEGIIGGVGAVITFLPNIVLLFLSFAILEDSGYMARAAFVMDKIMHVLGLHGKSFIPMLLGFGCNVPAIMGTRILESRKDRILTILANPLMSCAARLPIYTLFAGVFFTEHQGLVVFSIYLLGIVLAVLMARIFKSIFFRKEVAPFIMELPPYRLPGVKNVLFIMWQRARMFVRKAGTIILLGVTIIWLLASLPPGVDYASRESIIGRIGGFVAPMLAPAGFGFWQAAVALGFGVIAKEIVVGTLGTLYGIDQLDAALAQDFSPASAYAFMVMSLIYIPCVATIAAIRREAGYRWALLAVFYSLILGWTAATIIYQLASLL